MKSSSYLQAVPELPHFNITATSRTLRNCVLGFDDRVAVFPIGFGLQGSKTNLPVSSDTIVGGFQQDLAQITVPIAQCKLTTLVFRYP